jgi:TRAP-type C4-dicarboxylate transport system substrate-binding protein
MSSIRMVALAGMIAGSALVAGGALAEDLRLAHWVPAQHPLQPTGLEPWAASIAAASNGRLNITIFPAQQLGAAPDHYDMARDGIADIAFVNPGYQAGRFPIIAHGEIPFHITNAKGGDQLDRAGTSLIGIFKGVAPFVLTDLVRLALLVAFPRLVLFLPTTMD